MNRHQGLEWPRVQAKIEAHPEKLSSVYAMESTGGEPDVVGYDDKTDEYVSFGRPPVELVISSPYSTGACHLAQLLLSGKRGRALEHVF
jgi:hypothetical protein